MLPNWYESSTNLHPFSFPQELSSYEEESFEVTEDVLKDYRTLTEFVSWLHIRTNSEILNSLEVNFVPLFMKLLLS